MSLGLEILAYTAPDGFTRAVPVPEIPAFDGKIFVHKVSAKELDAVVAKDDDVNSRARYAALFACDEAGHRLWGDHQVEQIGNKPELLFLIERINYAGRVHNGLTEESRKLVEKNSAGGEESGSPASSAALATPVTASTGVA
jgi:hypothetical protein